MSGYNDPYRYPRDDRRGNDLPQRPYGNRDDHGGRGGRDLYGGGYGGRDDRYGRGDRSGGGYGGGGRPRPHWEDEGRDYKRGRYEDYDRGRGDTHSPYPPQHGGYPHQQHPQQHSYPGQPAQPAYGQPAYPQQPASSQAEAPSTGRKPVVAEAPSASVILLGLPAHVTEVHLRQFLEDMGASIDSTTVIMDRATGISKRFGFAKFSSVEHARAFIEPNFPSIPWKERHGPGPDDGMRIKINYSQKSGGWREDQGASARLTEDQRKAEGPASQGFYVNDGTRDIGSTPSQILLLRGLDPLSNEEEIVSALSRVGGRANQEIAKGGIKKVYVAKDRASRSSWGFAFVRFSDVRLATDVLAAVFNPRFHPSGFRVRSSVVAASFAHENSFIPVYAASPWAFASDGGQQLAYWDDKGFVQPWTPPQVNLAEALRNVPKAPRAVEEAKVDADMDAFFASIGEAEPEAVPPASIPPTATAAAAAPVPASPPTSTSTSIPSATSTETSANPPPPTLPPPGSVAPISIKPITALPGSAAASSPAKTEVVKPAAAAPPTPAAVPPAASATPLGAKEKKSDLIVSRKAAGSIAKWNTKAKELRTAPTAVPAPSVPAAQAAPQPQQASTTGTNTPPAPSASSADAPAVVYDDPEFEHGDPITFICLLCQRQFKGIEELRKHNKLSQLHKTNLTQPETVAVAATRKAASLKKHAAAAAASTAEANKPKYVDRAAARREALGQSDHPEAKGTKGKKKFDAPPAKEEVEETPAKNALEDEGNAGRKLLEKMGWSSGTGLGASGDGRVDAVQAQQFQKGAGLGATKGVAVGEEKKLTYTESLREKALERYNAS